MKYSTMRTSACTTEGSNGHREYTRLDNGYHAIGSVLGKRVMRKLLDHKKSDIVDGHCEEFELYLEYHLISLQMATP